MTEKEHKRPSIKYALSVLIGVLAIVLGANKLISAPIEPMFLVAWLLVYPACMHLGYTYKEIESGVLESCKNGLNAILILLVVGAMISTWIAAGTVPAIIYYGLQAINPKVFLLLTFWLCGLVSLSSGTSWGTMGTVGISMFAIGASLEIPSEMAVGAIVSGAFLGDMLSPMGGSANIVSASCGTDLMSHCKELIKLTIPVVIIASAVYFFLGAQFSGNGDSNTYVLGVNGALADLFNMGIWAFLPVILLLVLLITKRPAILSMLTSALVALCVAVIYQKLDINRAMSIFWTGYEIQTGGAFLDTLLNRGGVQSMFSPACIILFACGLVGAFNTVGMLETIVNPVLRKINNVLQLTATSQIISILGNMMGTNVFALIMTGSLMAPVYKSYNLHPTNLSKVIGATSTVCGPLIPWNASGIYVVALFGVGTLSFAPYALLTYFMPLAAFLFALFKISMTPAD